MPTAGNTAKSINWGGVAKGVAIVTAVAVAGVGVYLATPHVVAALTGWLGTGTMGSLFATAVQGATTAWNFIASEAAIIGTWISNVWAALPAKLGLTATIANTPAITAASQAGSGLAVAAGITATGAAIATAAPALHHTNFITEHAAHHAGEHSTKSWAAKNPPRRPTGAGFASQAAPQASGTSFASRAPQPAASKIDAEALRRATNELNKDPSLV